MKASTTVCLVDDHSLIRNGMSEIVNQFEGYTVIGQAANGKEFVDMVQQGIKPAVVILDIQMPLMNGEETALWIKRHHPEIKILVLTMHDDESNIIRMIRAGAKGYILKDADPSQLRIALDQVKDNLDYQSELVSSAFRRIALGEQAPLSGLIHFTEREKQFIKLACSELTYKEIADKMSCSVRTIDGHRDDVFAKLGIKNRIGLALFAIKTGIVEI
jgi:two-component system, NarL family, invasion response regulator UvrY